MLIIIALLFYTPIQLLAADIGGSKAGIQQIKLENQRMRQHLIRVTNILKIKNSRIVPGQQISNFLDESPKKKIKAMNGKFRNLVHQSPEIMKTLIRNVPKAMGRLRKRVVDNKIVGNDARNLFTYHGLIHLGNPEQQFKILFDTGSTRLWIRGPGQCAHGRCSTFDPSFSNSFVNSNITAPRIQYGDGSYVEGTWVSDKVQVADTWVNNFKFQLGTNVSDISDEDGIMGLGFSQMRLEPTYWEILVHNRLVTSPVFSFYIDSTETAGAITFGGVDTARYSGPLTWIPATGSMKGSFYWGLELDKISVGSAEVPLMQSEKYPIIDTGTSLGIFPPELAKKINNQLGLERVEVGGTQDDYRGFPCPSGKVPPAVNLPNLAFSFGSATITFTAQEYLFIHPDNNDNLFCVSGIIPGSSNIFIIGNVLLKRYYLVFDQSAKQIGFALANRQPVVTSHFVGAGAFNSPLGRADPILIPQDTVISSPLAEPRPMGTPVPGIVP